MPSEAILLTTRIFCNLPELSDKQVVQELVQAGIEQSYAARIVEFTSVVFARHILGPMGVRFSDIFIRRASNDYTKEQSLSSHPVWMEINEFVKTRGHMFGKDEWLAIAGRSAEFDAVNQLLNRGASLSNLILTPLSLQWPEGGPSSNTEMGKYEDE